MAKSTRRPIAITITIIKISVNFILFKYINVFQKKVSYAIRNINPAKPAKGIYSMIGAAANITINIVKDAQSVDNLLIPPDNTLILL